MIGTIIGAIVVGLIVGALARLVMPGKQNIGIIMTILLGAVGSFLARGSPIRSDTRTPTAASRSSPPSWSESSLPQC